MAIKARDQVTIAVGVDVASVDIYYKLQLSTATPPIKPSTANPSGWSTTEPTYDGVSTNTLYTCQKTTLTDGTFYWSSVSKSTSYEAAKTAWNLANSASTAAATAQSSIDNLQVGGRNLLKYSRDYSQGYSGTKTGAFDDIDGTYQQCTVWKHTKSQTSSYEEALYTIASIVSLWTVRPDEDYVLSFWAKASASLSIYSYFYNGSNNTCDLAETSTGYKGSSSDGGAITNIGMEWARYWIHWHFNSNTDPTIRKNLVVARMQNGVTGTIWIAGPKLEKGTRATDWTPAPEDSEERVTNAETKIEQNTTAIALRATKTDVYQGAQPNLMPMFSMDFDDIYNSTSNPDGYWNILDSSRITQGENGWAHVSSSVGGTTRYSVNPDFGGEIKASTIYTVLVEIKNLTSTGTVQFVANIHGQWSQSSYFYASSYFVPENGSKYITLSSNSSFDSATTMLYGYFYLSGTSPSIECDVRISLYEGEYSGPYKPYSGKHLYATQGDLASAIEYIEGTQTGVTGAWTGSTKDSALYAGKSIAYKLPYAGSGNATLSLVLGNVDIPSAWTDDATGSDVTGVNLLKNSATMSVGTSSSWANGVWRVAGGVTGMERSRVQITDGPNGSCYGVQGVGIHTNTMDATCWGIDSMPRTANGVYTFSFYARVVGGGVAKAGWNVGNAIKTIDTNATETYGTAQYWLKTLDSSGAWTRVWATVCATTASANIYIGVIATDTTSKTVQICNVKIEKLPTAIAPVYLGTTRMTTHFGAGSIIQMTYDGANWRATSIPNTNNIDRRLHNNAVYAVSNITSSRLICGTEAGYRDVASAATFDLSYPILYASAAITATNTATNTYEALPSVNFSMTGTIESGAAYKQLYLKGTVSGNIFTVAASPFLTTVQPTTANGYFYIPIGIMASATNGYFATSKDLYAYTDGAFRQVNPATIVATQKIYYRSNAESNGTGVKPNGNGLPTTWVTNTSSTFNTTATNASGWSTKVSPLTNDGVTGSTKYLYLWTCEQRKRLDGTVAYTDIVLDENTTVIDGGRIITNSITANKLNASDINASKSLTVGAMTDAAASTILNSNVQVGGRNLLLNSGTPSAYRAYITYAYQIAKIDMTERFVVGSTYTLQVWGTVARSDKSTTYFAAYWGGGSIALGNMQANSSRDYWYLTFTITSAQASGSGNANQWIELYNTPAVGASGTRYTNVITKAKLEKGNKATDWSPAPEDVDANISKAAQTATNFLTTVDSTGLFVHRASDASVSSGNGVKITSDVDIIRNGESVANYGEETRIGPEDERHVLITSDEFEFKDGNNIKAMLVAPTSGVEDVMLQLNVGPKDANGYATDYILRHGGQYSSSDGVGSSYIQASYSSGNISNLAGVFALASPNISQVQFIGNEITAIRNGHIYNASLDNLGFLLSARILLAGGDITLPANSGASATWPWQGPVIAGSSGQTAASFPNTNYIVVIGKSGNGQISGFDKVDFMVTGKTESQVTIAGWNSYSQAVTIHVVCIGFNSRYGSRA